MKQVFLDSTIEHKDTSKHKHRNAMKERHKLRQSNSFKTRPIETVQLLFLFAGFVTVHAACFCFAFQNFVCFKFCIKVLKEFHFCFVSGFASEQNTVYTLNIQV